MAKDRSPNYPAYDLGNAVAFAKKVFDAERKSSAKPEAIAGALGYAGLSGAARTKIATLRQYGLLEDAPEGKVRLSNRAIQLANLTPADADWAKVALEAALVPPLFREFRDKYPEASDRNLELDLITVKHFSPDGARRVIRSYRDTLRFAKAGAAGYNGPDDEADDEAENGKDKPSDADRRRAEDEAHRRQRHQETSSVTYSSPLEDAERLEVTFVGASGKKPTRRDLEAAIDYLELIKKRIPEAPAEPPEDPA
jgi:hypothetical protein